MKEEGSGLFLNDGYSKGIIRTSNNLQGRVDAKISKIVAQFYRKSF